MGIQLQRRRAMSTTPSSKSLVRMVPQILAEEDGHRAAAIAESEKVRFLVVVDEARAQEFRTIVDPQELAIAIGFDGGKILGGEGSIGGHYGEGEEFQGTLSAGEDGDQPMLPVAEDLESRSLSR